MIPAQGLKVHTGSVIIPLRETNGNNFHQVLIAGIVLCQKNQMVIPVLSVTLFSVEPGIRCNIYLTANDRINLRLLTGLIKLYHTVHDTMVCDGSTVHTKLLHPGHVFTYFIGPI